MADSTIDPEEFWDKTTCLKSISCTDEDLKRIICLNEIYTARYPSEAPFSFSKTISKAVEIAFANAYNPECKDMSQGRVADLDELDKRTPIIGKLRTEKSES